MSPLRYRDDDSSSGTTIATVLLGAAAGFAVGMYVAQRFGGFSGLKARFKSRAGTDEERPSPQFDFAGDDVDEIEEDVELGDQDALTAEEEDEEEDFNGMDAVEGHENVPLLEERVLEAFNHDPILAERAIDIGAVGKASIELAGWVDSDDEAEHAMTVARGVPGVETVVNRLLVDDEEPGKPATPKPGLENRWLSDREAVRGAADDVDLGARRRGKKGAKTETRPEA